MKPFRKNGNVFVTEIQGTVSVDIAIDAIRDAFLQPGYFENNNIFIFPDEYFKIQMDQMELVTKYILLNHPTNARTRKSAVVVPAGFNRSIVELWATSAKQLAYEMKIFSNLKASEEWVA